MRRCCRLDPRCLGHGASTWSFLETPSSSAFRGSPLGPVRRRRVAAARVRRARLASVTTELDEVTSRARKREAFMDRRHHEVKAREEAAGRQSAQLRDELTALARSAAEERERARQEHSDVSRRLELQRCAHARTRTHAHTHPGLSQWARGCLTHPSDNDRDLQTLP